MSKLFGSAFTGAAFADVGAMMAGYTSAWGVELDAAIAALANANLPHRDRVHVASVVGFDWGKLERVDHFHLSPPCQTFSAAKTHESKAKLIQALELAVQLAESCVEAISALEPSTVTLENVMGYRTPRVIDGKVYDPFQYIVDALYRLGYWVEWSVLDAADFGVPQHRKRLILRAIYGGYLAPLPVAVEHVGWHDAIADLIPTLPQAKLAAWQEKGLEGVTVDRPLMIHANNQRSLTMAWKNEPAFTQTAGGDSKHAPGSCHKFIFPGGTVLRENLPSKARIQSVSGGYNFAGVSAVVAYKALANGVPPLMMQKIMETFADAH